VLLAAALAPVSAGAAQSGARITVAGKAPLAVRGTSFHPGERVTITVTARSVRKRAVTASSRGAFRATFAGFALPFCESYSVRAKGNRGSVATLKITPECPAPRAVESEKPLTPTDPSGKP
jgi:hypothetical protein